MSAQEIITRYKYWIYGYILWLMPNIAFLIVGENGRRFFPFGLSFFNLSDYGFLEFFVYAIALPISAFIITDTLNHSKKARSIAKTVGITLLYLFDIIILFVTIRSVTLVVFGLLNDDLLYAFYHNWSIGEILFDFSGKPQTVLTIFGIALTVIIASLILRNYLRGNKFGLFYSGILCMSGLFLSWIVYLLCSKFGLVGFGLYVVGFILILILISAIDKKRKSVRLGMTKEMCLKKWGDAKEERIVQKGEDELDCLEYPEHDLYFKNDILSRIENRVIKERYRVETPEWIWFHFERDNTFMAHMQNSSSEMICGTYNISFGVINLITDTDFVFKKHGIKWVFGGKEVKGTIDGPSFTIHVQRISRGVTKTYDLTFRKSEY